MTKANSNSCACGRTTVYGTLPPPCMSACPYCNTIAGGLPLKQHDFSCEATVDGVKAMRCKYCLRTPDAAYVHVPIKQDQQKG